MLLYILNITLICYNKSYTSILGKGMLRITDPTGQYLIDIRYDLKVHGIQIIEERKDEASGSTMVIAEYDNLGSRQRNKIIKHFKKGYHLTVTDTHSFDPTIPLRVRNSLLTGTATYLTSLIPLFAATSDEVPHYLTVLEDAGIPNIRLFYPLITAFLPAGAASLTYFYTNPPES